MNDLKRFEAWFVTGSQHLYGPETLKQVDSDSKQIADALDKRMQNADVSGKTITLKIKYSDFTIQTRSKTIEYYVQKKSDFFPVVTELLRQDSVNDSVRLLGISISKLDAETKSDQLDVQLEMEF